jgi:hypothetical protein
VFTVTVRAALHTSPGRCDESLTLVTDDATLGTVTIPVHLWIKPDLYHSARGTHWAGTGSRVGAQVKTVVLIG